MKLRVRVADEGRRGRRRWTKGSLLSAVERERKKERERERDRERERERERTPAASKSRYLRPLSVTAVKRASRHSI